MSTIHAFVTQPPARCHNPPSTATTTPPRRRHGQVGDTTPGTLGLARQCHHHHHPPTTTTTTPPRRHRQTTPTAAATTTTTTVTGTLARRSHHCHDDADSAATAFGPGDLPVRPPLRAPSGFVHLRSCPPTLCVKKKTS